MSEKLLDALLKAEELELRGKKFYLKAAEKTLVPSVKELFKHLAYEEDLHREKIREIYQFFQQKKELPQYITKVSKKQFNPIFDPKQLEKVAGVETEIAALEKALNFEEKSMKYYQKLSEKTKDPKVKRFFLTLVQEEWSHYLSIFDSIEFLKDPTSWHTFKERWGLDGA
jgi:rubrerythrin